MYSNYSEWVNDCITQEKLNIWFDQTTIEIEQKKNSKYANT